MKLNKISAMFSDTKSKATNISIFGAALTALLTLPAYAAEPTEQADTDDIEVIAVKGIFGSLKAANLMKRTDDRIVDAIVAEDIGKLPDNNIAEALQRITGVSIGTDFGVGESVTIRGVSENLVLLNGRSTAGAGRGGIGLDDFPSSFLKTVEVIKSPTPDMIEGALGGTVNMKTIRPLELSEPLVAITLDGEYADKTENTAPNFSMGIGNNWDLGDAGSFGASANLAYLDRELRRDEFFSKVDLQDNIDIDGDGIVDDSGGPNGKYLRRTQNTVEQKTEERERTAYGISLQWEPVSAEANIYLDLNATKLDGGQSAYSILDVGGSSVARSDSYYDSNGELHNYDLDGVLVIPKTWSDFTTSDTTSHAIGGEWFLTDSIEISAEYSLSKSEEKQTANEFNLRPIERTDPTTDLVTHTSTSSSYSGGGIPGYMYADSGMLTNPDNLVFREFFHKTLETDNEEQALRFDFKMSDIGVDWVSAVKAGVRFTDRDYTANRYDLKPINGNTTLKDSYKKAVDDNGNFAPIWIDNALLSDSMNIVNLNNSFDQTGVNGQNDLLTYNVYDADQLQNTEATYELVKQMLAGTSYAMNGSLADNMVEDNGAYKEINEKTSAIYAQFHLDFDDLTAVFGGRYIQTELESSVVASVDADGNKVLDTGKNDYSDFLPSLNVTYTLTDETLMRFAAAKVMRRADFDELSPALSIDNSLVTGTQGSYQLEPYRVTQYDFSVEHYFGDGGLVSAALFYKDVNSFTQTDSSCLADASTVSGQNTTEWGNICLLDTAGQSQGDVNFATEDQGLAYVDQQKAAGQTGIVIDTDVNGGSGEVKGIELAYQQQFTFLPGFWSGFGVNANYTYADSAQPDGNPLLNISENTANGQIYWENEDLQFRLAYNWRDRYLYSQAEKRVQTVGALGYNVFNQNDPTADNFDATVGNNYREARGQFDFSASWDINEHFAVVGNVVNLTGEPIEYTTELGSVWKYSESDRRYTLGLRARF
ncbi:TonB-dependent receptor [Shewanella sp. 1_MG-2023]|uniref:TonB-dependent receptor n=1 Tax=unclassified Shewanella TaxID=196818 RepID=UPI000C8206D9|nr:MULTISPECIES: TonB-dependent receptor [unclassified Shewanella]MDO6611941.1 TonB-dependent receptor [Shewanella sp. 7_MG-2023]MDO6771796.1 TonB-dependent receptor [Shewanella sp. 2_MG-2023]MDO6794022.1 TonB-dependent receptor [Shewanella sp. 1_MG-2023]PMG76410.1 TonB-dependent receptor [Shewanella sp. 10N.286.51.B7]